MQLSVKYRPDIDGLRAVAVLGVVIYHAFPRLLTGGFVGVDVFFVISGFLITEIIVSEIDQKKFSLKAFYFRRIRRIFPALVVMLIVVFFLGWFLLLAPELANLGKHMMASAAFFQNFNLSNEVGYFDINADRKPLLHLWSLSIEEQYYFIWPTIVLLALQKNRRWLVVLSALLLLISFKLSLYYLHTTPARAFFYSQVRFWELLIGSILGFFAINSNLNLIERSRFIQNLLSVLGSALLFSSMVYISRDENSQGLLGYMGLGPTLGAALLLVSKNSWLNQKILSNRAAAGIGLTSYPLYLWHWPLLSIFRITSESADLKTDLGNTLIFLFVLVSAALAFLTYKLIEIPIKELFANHPQKVVTLCCLALLFTGSLGAFTNEHSGFPNRAAAQRKNLEAFQPKFHSGELIDCREQTQVPGVENCFTTAPDLKNIDVAVIGDSHSLSLAFFLGGYYREKSKKMILFQTGSTIGLRGIGTVMGGEFTIDGDIRSLDKAYDWALEHGIKTFVLIDRGPVYVTGEGFGKYGQHLTTADRINRSENDPAHIFENGLRRTLAELTNKQKEIIFVFDNPEFPFDPVSECFGRPVSFLPQHVIWPCSIPADTVIKRQRPYRDLVQKVLKDFPSVKTFDPQPYICNSHDCSPIQDGILLYSDYNHFTRSGAMWLKDKGNFYSVF